MAAPLWLPHQFLQFRNKFDIDKISCKAYDDTFYNVERYDACSDYSPDICNQISMINNQTIHRKQYKIIEHRHHYSQGDDAERETGYQ